VSIRWRLTLTYTSILILIILAFGGAVYLLTAQALLADIDASLLRRANQLSEQTKAVFLGEDTQLTLLENLDMFEASTLFAMLLDADGDVLESTPNLSSMNRALSTNGLTWTVSDYDTVTVGDNQLRVVSVPLNLDGTDERQIVGHLQVASLMDGYYSNLVRLQWTLLLTGLGMVSLSLLIGVWYTPSSLKNLNEISSVALQITRADDLGRRLPDSGKNDEISRMTRALNITLERLEKLFRTQQRFLADISHELRTPLTTVRGNVDLMRRMGESDPESLDAMKEELERMSRLVGDLLFLARADSGGLPIQKAEVELDTAFLDVYRQVHRLPKRVAIELEEVDQMKVMGDVDRLKQVILILVDNAIKYTPAGGKVTLSLSQADGLATIRVSDTGVGIPAADLPFIFDRFYRVDKARTRAMGGSGLGLSIAKWVAEAHGGQIRVTSKVDEGTTFSVILPALLPPPDPLPTPDPATAKTRPMRVLSAFRQQEN
jgi:heavy metal sensor kinase